MFPSPAGNPAVTTAISPASNPAKSSATLAAVANNSSVFDVSATTTGWTPQYNAKDVAVFSQEVAATTGQVVTLFDKWWQTALFVFDIFMLAGFIGFLVMFILRKKGTKKNEHI